MFKNFIGSKFLWSLGLEGVVVYFNLVLGNEFRILRRVGYVFNYLVIFLVFIFLFIKV